jgi:hypothetical protein
VLTSCFLRWGLALAVLRGFPCAAVLSHFLSTLWSRSATLFSIRKMSISSALKERAIVLFGQAHVSLSSRLLGRLDPKRGALSRAREKENSRLRTAAIWLPVTLELIVGSVHSCGGVLCARHDGSKYEAMI